MIAPGAARSPRRCSLAPPAWAQELVPALAGARWRSVAGTRLRAAEAPGFSLIEVSIPGAAELEAKAFESACATAYELIFAELARCRAAHPVRMWNFIPGILAPLGAQPHRYMCFNFGRYAAFTRRFGGNGFVESIATASGVGHDGADLGLVCLAAERRGEPVENPRQIASYFYSNRYGLLPPCFARATRLDRPGEPALLLVGGTASVCGEDSVHLEDLMAQTEETFLNLAMVVQVAEDVSEATLQPADPAVDELLERYRRLRVYYVEPRHRATVEELVGRRLPAGVEVEYLRADLCRPELLIEIEGLAELRSPGSAEP